MTTNCGGAWKRVSPLYFIKRIKKKLGWYDLEKEGCKWVRDNLGKEYVEEFKQKYESIQQGVPIGGFEETIIFLDMIERIKNEI